MKALTPHDKFFRAFLGSDMENARDLIRSALPARLCGQLELSELRVSQGSFVDQRLRGGQSDLLLRTRRVGGEPVLIYILVEHKARVDQWTLLQLLRYMSSIWWREVEGRRRRGARGGRGAGSAGGRGLPVIIPLIFWQGEGGWSAPVQFSEYFRAGGELSGYVPSFRALLYTLERVPEASEVGVIYRAGVMLMRAMVRDLRAALPGILSSLGAAPLDQRMRLFLERALEYTMRAGILDEGELEEAIEESGFAESREVFMTLAEKLIEKGRQEGKQEGRREGWQEGKQEGKQEGRQEERRRLLMRLLARESAVSAQERAMIEEVRDLGRLDRAIDAALDGAPREEVLACLG